MKGVKKVVLMDFGVVVIVDNIWRVKNVVLVLDLVEDDMGNFFIFLESIN